MSSKHIDQNTLRNLIPFNGLDLDQAVRLLRDAKESQIPVGQTLFKRGDTQRCTYYLLEGELILSSPLAAEERLTAGSEAARYPIAHQLPRHANARAQTPLRVLIINYDITELLHEIRTTTASSSVHDEAWKTKWLQSPLFRHMPDDNIEALLQRMEEIRVEAGQVIIHQDEYADCYFVIKQGRCSVSRRPAPRSRDVKLAELNVGQGFGEEALITHATRNASITMLEDGLLLRLSKDDFINLVATPLLRHISFDEAMALADTVLVDVRSPEEFETDGLLGSLNMPMPVLRLKAHRFDTRQTYVVYSNTGNFSTAAAFLLLQQGLDAYVLKGGLNSVPRHRLKQAQAHQKAPSQHETHRVLPFPAAASPTQTEPDKQSHSDQSLRFDWVSDEAMWRNTIGLRDDHKINALFTPSDMYRNQAQDTSIQGFDEVRLFTKVEGGKLSLLSSDDSPAGNRSAAAEACGQSASEHEPRHSDSSYATAGPRAGIPHKTTAPAFARLPRKRISLVALVVVVLLGSALSAVYIHNDDVRAVVDEAPEWIKQQRDIDAKLNRLLETMEKLPGLKPTQTPLPLPALPEQTAPDSAT